MLMARNFLTDLNLNQNRLLSAAIEFRTQHPENPVLGQIYINSVNANIYVYTALGWLEIVGDLYKFSYVPVDSGSFTEPLDSSLAVDGGAFTMTSNDYPEYSIVDGGVY